MWLAKCEGQGLRLYGIWLQCLIGSKSLNSKKENNRMKDKELRIQTALLLFVA